jgi:hypothetical protein
MVQARPILHFDTSSEGEAAMSMQAIETVGGKPESGPALQALAGVSAKRRPDSCAQARTGCPASCPRFAQCGPSALQVLAATGVGV